MAVKSRQCEVKRSKAREGHAWRRKARNSETRPGKSRKERQIEARPGKAGKAGQDQERRGKVR